MPKVIDKERVLAMYATGCFTQRRMAERLGYSEKTVREVIRAAIAGGMFPVAVVQDMAEPEDERLMWFLLRSGGFSLASIAYSFGVTRQAVWEGLNRVEVELLTAEDYR